MKKFNTLILFTFLLLAATSCRVVGDIFGAGFYTGIFFVVFLVVIVLFIIARVFRRK